MPAPTYDDDIVKPTRGSSRTVYATALALLPVMQFVLLLAEFLGSGGTMLRFSTTVVVLVLSLIGSVLLARFDQRVLYLRGYRRDTTPKLALIPLAYLFVRGNRCWNDAGEGLGTAWFGVAVYGFLFALGPGALQFVRGVIFAWMLNPWG